MSLRRSGPGRPEPVSRNALHPLPWRFSGVCADRVLVRSFPTCVGRVRHRSEAVNIDRGQFVGRGLNDVAIVMDLHELAPVGGRATSRGGGTRSASLSKNSYGESSTTPLAPGRVDLRLRLGPTQLAAQRMTQRLGST